MKVAQSPVIAMRDALELSEYLTSDQYDTLQDAISSYEINMRERASKAAQQSLEMVHGCTRKGIGKDAGNFWEK